MLSTSSKLQDRYRIIRHLGQGGMGTVYEAIDERVNCVVAIKETLRGDKGAFKREAELLANLRHPSLPRVTDYFSVDEGSFLVMDFIPGNDFAELLELRGSPFPIEQVLGWADKLLQVLEYLHRRGVLHRDIKPSNLKLTRTGEIFLLDFGLAKGAAGQMSTLKTNRSVFGYTLAYASLEQIHEHGTDARSDLYSLGATLYHLLTGVLPIDAAKRDLTINDEDPDPLRPVHELNRQVSLAVSAVVQQSMAISRKRRPESAAEMRRLLSEASRTASLGKEKANEEHRQREAEEELRRARDAEEARRRREAVNGAIPMIPPTLKVSPSVGAFDAPAQMNTRQAPPPIFQPFYSQSASPLGAPSGIDRKGGHKFWLPMVVAGMVLAFVVIIIVIGTIRQSSVNQAAQNNSSENVPLTIANNAYGNTASNISNNTSVKTNANIPKDTPSTTPRQTAPQLEMVLIPKGAFMMGSPDEPGSSEFEQPQHLVLLQSFYIGKYEVTQAQYRAVMGTNPSSFLGDNLPVENVSWDDAKEFCRRLSQMTGRKYRLPSEAEWEYACRAGTTTRFAYGSSISSDQANFDGNYPSGGAAKGVYRRTTTPVGTFQPNAFGIYDMHGNVYEWCEDLFHKYYNGAPTDGSAWVSGGGESRILRGGSWSTGGSSLPCVSRGLSRPGNRDSGHGFRVVADSRSS